MNWNDRKEVFCRTLSLPNSCSNPLFQPSLIPTPTSFPPLSPHSNFTPSSRSLHPNFTPKTPNPSLHPVPHPITIPRLHPPDPHHPVSAPRTVFSPFFQHYKFYFYLYLFFERGSWIIPPGTEVGGMVMAVSMDSIAWIWRIVHTPLKESTSLVRTIMAVGAAIGSIITRTGQSSGNGTTK